MLATTIMRDPETVPWFLFFLFVAPIIGFWLFHICILEKHLGYPCCQTPVKKTINTVVMILAIALIAGSIFTWISTGDGTGVMASVLLFSVFIEFLRKPKDIESKKSKWNFNFKDLFAVYFVAIILIVFMTFIWPSREMIDNAKARQWFRWGPKSGQDLAKIKELVEVSELYLNYVKISTKGLEHLAKLKKLKSIHFYGPKVNDSLLVYLQPLHNLNNLYFKNTKVTKTGIAKLQKALPKCKITTQ